MTVELWLRVEEVPGSATLVGLVDEAVIGRDLRCDVVVNDVQASRVHARVTPSADDTWTITDLATTNGTYVNEQLIVGPARLVSGDVIRIGRASCAVVQPGSLVR